MRQIKFRAWIKSTKRMAIVVGLCYTPKELQIEVMREGFKLSNKKSEMEWWWNDKEAILLQFIGFKDKNNKEIYEGDIVKCQIGLVENKEFLTEVIQSICWIIPNGQLSIGGIYQIEVIGNVYENSDFIRPLSRPAKSVAAPKNLGPQLSEKLREQGARLSGGDRLARSRRLKIEYHRAQARARDARKGRS